jgi:hypothetical protein
MAMSIKPTIYTHDEYLSDQDEDTFEDAEVEMGYSDEEDT